MSIQMRPPSGFELARTHRKRRRNMRGLPTFPKWVSSRMVQIWPEMSNPQRMRQMALMAAIKEDELWDILHNNAKPTEDQLHALCHAGGYAWDQIKSIIWNPEPDQPLWRTSAGLITP